MTEGMPAEGWVGTWVLMVLLTAVQAVDLPVLAVKMDVVVFVFSLVVMTGVLLVVLLAILLLVVVGGIEVVVGACEVVDGGGLEVAATRPEMVYAAAQAVKSMSLGQHQVWALVS